MIVQTLGSDFMRIHDYHAAQAGGSSEAVPMSWWQGWTGRWYVTTVSPLARFTCAEPGFYIIARRELDGTRTPLMVGTADDIGHDLATERAADLAAAWEAGANEVHLHLLDSSELSRDAAVKDLARAWALPLASRTPFSQRANPPVRMPARRER